ncbi:aromatic amino acid lyase [Nocardioides fonticola]|uniref:Aromatic amino acid lyase n=1 Tax=Nocardioides fonticola TaxID=450363 RepID=A0ABP7XM17_9ACTN
MTGLTEPTGPTGPTGPTITITTPDALDAAAVRAVAAGARLHLDDALLAAVGERRAAAVAALAEGAPAYGVTSGMGALADRRLTAEEQAGHSVRLMAARAVGEAPWLEQPESRALVAVRLRTLLHPESGVSADLCARLAALLGRPDPLPPVPRTGNGAAGEILPLAHAWADLAADGLGPKEGIALLAGTPLATALALLRAEETRVLAHQAVLAAAGAIAVAGVPHDPYRPELARDDDVLAGVLADLGRRLGDAPDPTLRRHLQAPVSLRVVGPVLAAVHRAATALEDAAARALCGVTDSPAFLDDAFVGTPGFHGIDLAATAAGARYAVVHAAAVGAARVHRLLDPEVTGLPAQLSADPGPQAGLTPLHKRLVGEVRAVADGGVPLPMETSQGQEDVQSFALEESERLRVALGAWRTVLAGELLAVHQARLLGAPVPTALQPALDEVAAVLPEGADDRPRGTDLAAISALLAAGWSSPAPPAAGR